MSIGKIGEQLRRSTVQIRSSRNGSGSGVIWNASGAIVTNAHIVRSGELHIELWDGRTAPARIEKRNSRRDLAILRTDAGDLTPASAGDSDRVRAGEVVIAVGNPLGFTGALSTGVVHAVGPDFIQTTVRLAPGNSGGPLADSNGNVIGINTAIVPGGLSLAIPISDVRRLLTNPAPIELGVTLEPVRIRRHDGGIALLVLEIAADSLAEYASLRPGDVLVGAGGRRFTSIDDLRDSLERGGQLLTIQFLRGDSKPREVTVRLRHEAAA